MSALDASPTVAPQAAIARVAYALESPPAVVLLCGPRGVGKSFVLASVAAACSQRGRRCRTSSIRDLAADVGGDGATILIVDDAHEAVDGQLRTIVESWRRSEPQGGVVLAGEGRLLTLAARDERLERAILLRATLGPFTLAETRLAVAARLARIGSASARDAVASRIHEIAAGIPARIFRLADLVQVVSAAAPDGLVSADDVEAVHQRLVLQAA